mgnify:CR=1 FL=1
MEGRGADSGCLTRRERGNGVTSVRPGDSKIDGAGGVVRRLRRGAASIGAKRRDGGGASFSRGQGRTREEEGKKRERKKKKEKKRRGRKRKRKK